MIGVVAQRSGADPTATGRENLILQGRLYGMRDGAVRARADELLTHFGLTEAAGRLVKTYSGGMQRRLDVALGLMHRPAAETAGATGTPPFRLFRLPFTGNWHRRLAGHGFQLGGRIIEHR